MGFKILENLSGGRKMPIYEYVCEKCGNKFDEFFWADEDTSKLKCPKCGDKKLTKTVSAFSTGSKGSKDSSCAPRSFG
jgi:putative FmdB family regulatory protein